MASIRGWWRARWESCAFRPDTQAVYYRGGQFTIISSGAAPPCLNRPQWSCAVATDDELPEVGVEHRAGRYIRQPTGYRAFVPAPLPPVPGVNFDSRLLAALAAAADALGRLDGVASTIPNPDLFVAMYVRREAVLSSQIEGTQASLDDVLAFELEPSRGGLPADVEEVVNYVRAMNYGLARLAELPLSLRLIREIHAQLVTGVRGHEKNPGEFRRTQNWIGPGGVSLSDASFVPPPPHEMLGALDNLEKFMHEPHGLPPLVECALIHSQFETIHPFLDGNGQVGRLLITFLLVHRGVLHRPLLYISYFFKRFRGEYYERLMAVREAGDWEGWTEFFLRGVQLTATEAVETARRINALRVEHHNRVRVEAAGATAVRLLDMLYERPVVNVGLVAEYLDVTFPTANNAVQALEALGLLEELTGGRRNRVFRYSSFLDLFADVPEEVAPAAVEVTETQ